MSFAVNDPENFITALSQGFGMARIACQLFEALVELIKRANLDKRSFTSKEIAEAAGFALPQSRAAKAILEAFWPMGCPVFLEGWGPDDQWTAQWGENFLPWLNAADIRAPLAAVISATKEWRPDPMYGGTVQYAVPRTASLGSEPAEAEGAQNREDERGSGVKNARAFISYSHRDAQYKDELLKHLSLLTREGHLSAWHDGEIPAGGELDPIIVEELKSADIVVLLISSDFIASDYCFSREMMTAMERHERGEVVVVPVIVRTCDWHSAPFAKLKALPRDGKAISSFSDVDEAYSQVARGLRTLLRASADAPNLNKSAKRGEVAAKDVLATRGSSNVRLPGGVTDQDRDRFLRDAFETIQQYFRESLTSLERENPGICVETRVRTAEEFTTVVYREGNRTGVCTVGIVSLSDYGAPQIHYSGNESLGGGFNEAISVEIAPDGRSLVLKALMNGMKGSRSGMVAEEAAKLLWDMLLERPR